jgi:hypothetical protein
VDQETIDKKLEGVNSVWAPSNQTTVGLKYDQGKPRWELLPIHVLDGVASVLTFGANKYADNSWQGIERHRYEGALRRHLSAIDRGEELDPESGLPHIDHALCNLIFMKWKDIHGENDNTPCR